ncbi:MAG: MFS transporter [Bacteroidota bacterium]
MIRDTMMNCYPYSPEFEKATYRKVTLRLIPFLILCFIIAYVDRINVGFAKLEMQKDLGMSDAVYGMAAGIFFIGYFFFEVPSNMALQRLGARRWIAPIMIIWGCISSCTMFTRSAAFFYIIRFVLGLFEAGFFPGVILYLTFWYSRRHRAKMVAAFMTAIALSGVIGGPISGWILSNMSGMYGLKGWQWLFFLQGIPSVVVGSLVYYVLDDNPTKAKWLTADERNLLVQRLAEDEEIKNAQGHSPHTLKDVFKSPAVWLFCLVYFGIIMGTYGIGFWLPQIIQDSITKNVWKIGLISAVPWAFGAITMVWNGHHSDVTGERRWHIALAAIIGSVAFAASGIPGISGLAAVIALSFATAGVMSALSSFWALPTSILSATAAAAGIAWINSIGNLAGYVSPYIIGKIRDATHNMWHALLVLSAFCLMSALIVLCMPQKKNTINNL